MGLDHYLHRIDILSEYRKKDLQRGLSYKQFCRMDRAGNWVCTEADSYDIDDVIKTYGVLTQVERQYTDFKKMFNDYYPNIDYDSVHLWRIGGDVDRMTYSFNQPKNENNVDNELKFTEYTITLSLEEEREKYTYYEYKPCWVYRYETVCQWRKAYNVRKWMQKKINADTEKDCYHFLMTKDDVLKLYNWSKNYESIESYQLRKEKEETFKQLRDNVIDDTDWDNEVIAYYEWY